MANTDRYNLQRLTSNDLSPNSYKFSDADRVLIDALLYLGAEAHRHTGGAASDNAPDTAPTVQLDTSAGSLPAGTRIYYKFTYVDGSGIETTASPEVFIDTPAAVVAPSRPTLATQTTGGTLSPGNYYYVLTAYDIFDSLETTADNAAYISVPYTTATNLNTLTFPALPSGATGFNIYRKGPSNTGYRYLASVDMDVATPPTEFEDDGSYTEDQDRPLPTGNSTISTNSVELTLPGATPALPDIGYYWRIYRTFIAGDYTNSVLVTTDEITYVDDGDATTVGSPPTTGASVGAPTKILLTDAAEVQGQLPTANIADFTTEVTELVEALTDVVQGNIDDHLADTDDGHDASAVSYAGSVDLVATTVEGALDELDVEKLSRFGGHKHGFINGGNSSTAHTILLTVANVYRLILTGNCVITMPTVSAPQTGATPAAFAHEFELFLVQDVTGTRTVTWPASVRWPSATAPTLTTTPGKTDWFRFETFDNGTTWYGEVIGQNY